MVQIKIKLIIQLKIQLNLHVQINQHTIKRYNYGVYGGNKAPKKCFSSLNCDWHQIQEFYHNLKSFQPVP